MARNTGPVCRMCRREGLKLFLKGQRCLTEKCSFNDRKAPPGPPAKRKNKLSAYGVQLREKQKVKRVYGVLETPFRNYYKTALRMKGIAGENLLVLLERRLDNTLYRMGIALSRAQARNVISHGHVRVNGKKVDIASYQIRIGDKVSLSEKIIESSLIKNNINIARGIGLVSEWIEMAEDGLAGTVVKMPTRENIDIPIKEQIIIEHYSK